MVTEKPSITIRKSKSDLPWQRQNFKYWPALISILLILNDLGIQRVNATTTTNLETNKHKLAQKKQWLESLLSNSRHREKRQINGKNANIIAPYQSRPCPINCNCNYDTVSCSDIIAECLECSHWSEIDFNQITSMKPRQFANFKFAAGRTTHIIIYKLINSTLAADVFRDLIVPENARIEITFQYNSVIKFDKNVLNGVQLNSNSTLVFNFPYTTQVIFVSKCFDNVKMADQSSKLIIRVLKSFSVRFVNDFIIQGFLNYKAKLHKLAASKNISIDKAHGFMNAENPEEHINELNSSWNLNKGQLIVDIKSTHLVKFEDYALAYMRINSGAKFYLDMDLIEKLMVQRHAFSNLDLEPQSKLTIYGRHLTFMDFRAHSFSAITLQQNARMQIYLSELLHSLCLQRNVFDTLTLNEHSHFNFSIINSKNVMLMHDSFASVNLNSPHAKLFVGVYNKPSFQLKLKNNNYYQEFLKERMAYRRSTNFGSSDQGNYDQFTGLYQAPYPISSDYYYSTINSKNELDLRNYFKKHKQVYGYNMSIEQNCFSNLQYNFNDQGQNIWIVADNINTLLIDDSIVSNNQAKLKNFNFLLNVNNLVFNPRSFDALNQIRIEFLSKPQVLNLNISGIEPQRPSRQIKLIGLGLNERYTNTEQDNLDFANGFESRILNNDYCDLAQMSALHTVFLIEPRFDHEKSELCACESIYLLMNQLNKFDELNKQILPCKLDANTLHICQQKLKQTCQHKKQAQNETTTGNYIKFWEYCISEFDPAKANLKPGYKADAGNYYYNNQNDPDGMFSASLSSSSFYEQSDSFKSSFSKPGVGGSSELESFDDHESSISSSITNIGKIVGLILALFLTGIIMFMIIINIIQYKFRNELIDDLEYNGNMPAGSYTQNRTGQVSKDASNIEDPKQQNFWKKTFSVNSLRRTLSVASLKSKRDVNKLNSELAARHNREKDDCSSDEEEDDDDRYADSRFRQNRHQQKCSDSFYEDDADSVDSNDISDDFYENEKYSKSDEKSRLKTSNNYKNEIGPNYSGNRSELMNQGSSINSDRTVLTPPPAYRKK